MLAVAPEDPRFVCWHPKEMHLPGMTGAMQPSLAGKRYFYCKPVKEMLHPDWHRAGISSGAGQQSCLCPQPVPGVLAPPTAKARSVGEAEAPGAHGSFLWC